MPGGETCVSEWGANLGEHSCNFCSGPATLQCSRCLCVHYCSKVHQRSDWAKHKTTCRALSDEEREAKLAQQKKAAADFERAQAERNIRRDFYDEDDSSVTRSTPNASSELAKNLASQVIARSKRDEASGTSQAKGSHEARLSEVDVDASAPVYEVRESVDKGRVLVASRDIPAGFLIFEEKPLLMCAAGLDHATCMRCFKLIDEDVEEMSVRCRGCGHHFCSKRCQREIKHVHKVECELLSHPRFKSWIDQSPMTYLFVARAIATKHAQPDVWKEVKKLMPLSSLPKAYKSAASMVASVVKAEMPEVSITHADIEHIFQVCTVNAHKCHRVMDDEPLINDSLVGLYMLGSMPEHSCVPNCGKSFGVLGNDVILQFRTLRDVQEGESLSLSYMNLHMPTHVRQAELMQREFRCSCSRCQDVTEFDSNISSIRCKSCPSGYHLPPCVDYDLKKFAWACGACGEKMSWDQVLKLEGDLKVKLFEIENEAIWDPAEKEAAIDFRERIRPQLHPNHWIIVRCDLLIATVWYEDFEEETEMLESFGVREACDNVLRVLDKFGPEMSQARARLYHVKSCTCQTQEEAYELMDRAVSLRVLLYGEDKSERYI
eukprot:gnl/TRDRNA2_/TRDRNA2_173276_c0_seq6.p1 gnl/TRDRNA2_/TRDRNA2_173276_c0~~gnl/TRDRNA2_/TRDRNA2_173276_c0_seq6.p1  ORF type:complete len:630 (+),score=107.16 gnl/TRDRNA2_/TRDRNA2_173276_c0_seq6:78-1892(+)